MWNISKVKVKVLSHPSKVCWQFKDSGLQRKHLRKHWLLFRSSWTVCFSENHLWWKWSDLSFDAAAAAEEVVVVEVDGGLLGGGHLLLRLHLAQACCQLHHLCHTLTTRDYFLQSKPDCWGFQRSLWCDWQGCSPPWLVNSRLANSFCANFSVLLILPWHRLSLTKASSQASFYNIHFVKKNLFMELM